LNAGGARFDPGGATLPLQPLYLKLMKYRLPICLLAVAVLNLTASAQNSPQSAQNPKIATIDMQKLLASYYKSEQANLEFGRTIREAQEKMKEKVATREQAVAEIKKFSGDILKPELSKDAKQGKAQARDEKIAALKAMDSELQAEDARIKKDLQLKNVALRNEIYGEVLKVVEEKVKTEHYQFVIDRSSVGAATGLPVLIYGNKECDITEEVLAVLNKNKPKESAAPRKK
jgi:Skp family chaperone for outer membrane proteins